MKRGRRISFTSDVSFPSCESAYDTFCSHNLQTFVLMSFESRGVRLPLDSIRSETNRMMHRQPLTSAGNARGRWQANEHGYSTARQTLAHTGRDTRCRCSPCNPIVSSSQRRSRVP